MIKRSARRSHSRQSVSVELKTIRVKEIRSETTASCYRRVDLPTTCPKCHTSYKSNSSCRTGRKLRPLDQRPCVFHSGPESLAGFFAPASRNALSWSSRVCADRLRATRPRVTKPSSQPCSRQRTKGDCRSRCATLRRDHRCPEFGFQDFPAHGRSNDPELETTALPSICSSDKGRRD